MKIFVNAKTEQLCGSIAAALDESGAEVTLCFDDETANCDLSGYDVVIVSTPLRSEFGMNYIAGLARRTSACVIVLARTDIAEDLQNRISFTGAYVLSRPFSKSALSQTIKVALRAKDIIHRIEKEKDRLTKELDDTNVINRAKCCLIQYLNMTEEQAHRHIGKLAMDTRRTKREIAEDILRTYGGATNV